MNLFIVFGDHLFPFSYFEPFKAFQFITIEASDICSHFRYHQHRLIFLISAQRHKRLELIKGGLRVDHVPLDHDFEKSYFEKLGDYCKKNKVEIIHSFEKDDKFFRNALSQFCEKNKIKQVIYPSPLFLNSRNDFKQYLSRHKKPFMKNFYEESRKRFNILMEKDGTPVGGRYSFDEENRSKLKKGVKVPSQLLIPLDQISLDVKNLIKKYFPDNPGSSNGKDQSAILFPVTREAALLHLENFLKYKMHNFGEFEDAMSESEDFVFHSLLSPLINVGLLTPKEVMEETLKYAKKHKPPLNSLEGFIRQIIGWREFVRGIYNEYSEEYEGKNFFKHQRKLKPNFFTGETGILPLDHVIKKVNRYAYAHHIERLMILSNLMLLLEVDPKIIHQYFNEYFIDSMDWVMGPNVYCMGQFSDGGIFATKPYICGSNYILKMSDFKKGDWCQEIDALYWSFIYNKIDFFSTQPRLSMMVAQVAKMDKQKLNNHLELAKKVKERITYLD
jgi:deoxyribodipyrimidine photolyase-related protein